MRAIIYIPKEELKYQNSLLTNFPKFDIITYYNVYNNKDEEFNYVTAHFMMYTKILDLCMKENSDYLFILGRIFPEYLYDELSVRPDLTTHIVFEIEKNEENEYPARKLVLKKLRKFKNIKTIGE